jgi:hypothetical protein
MSTSHAYLLDSTQARVNPAAGHGARPQAHEYDRRMRPLSAVVSLPLGASRESEFLGRWYQRDATTPVPEAADADPAVAALDRLLLLPPDWDGRRAPAPSRNAIERAREILQIAREVGLVGARVSPDVEGGVALYFFGGGPMEDGGTARQAGVLLSNEGDAASYMRDRTQRGSQVAAVDDGRDGLVRAVEAIRAFVRSE